MGYPWALTVGTADLCFHCNPGCFFYVSLTVGTAMTGPSLGKNESSNFPGSSLAVFRFSILEISFCLENIFEKYVGEISMNK